MEESIVDDDDDDDRQRLGAVDNDEEAVGWYEPTAVDPSLVAPTKRAWNSLNGAYGKRVGECFVWLTPHRDWCFVCGCGCGIPYYI